MLGRVIGLVLVAMAVSAIASAQERLKPGDTFRDCADCPELVVIPAGNFTMGDLHGVGYFSEKLIRTVRIDYAFAIGKFELTFDVPASLHRGQSFAQSSVSFRGACMICSE